MASSVDLELPSTPEAPKQARDSIELLGDRVSQGVLDDVRLLVSELVTNSLRHGDLPQDDTINLRAEVTPQGVRVEVTDAGGGFKPRSRRQLTDPTGGYGLYLVHRLASRWGVDSQGERSTRVWFEIDRPAPGHLTV